MLIHCCILLDFFFMNYTRESSWKVGLPTTLLLQFNKL
jgi:hypothetical protein